MLVRPDGDAAKPWLTVVLDDYRRPVAGYFLSFEDPPAHVLGITPGNLAQRGFTLDCVRIPDVLYTDYGSDFTSRHLE
jgi:putative transposase